MADSEVIQKLVKATGKTREECEKALKAVGGNYVMAVAKLGPAPESAPGLVEAAGGKIRNVNAPQILGVLAPGGNYPTDFPDVKKG